jgi:hypothetical protein
VRTPQNNYLQLPKLHRHLSSATSGRHHRRRGLGSGR